ncbi:hypothetical protein K402DRAFT_409251 [Aulographum hederae CBS 113979]|uniref:Signal recognition particle subunit SRP68 n=1 Tax=Aulographum hederae CBS 113979 TaxID=1176131 RepID=A0A6G1HH38_9PEZI|nr:hypothetical protein K402DRAFT_409251 [Aulographum hederae CBS 113979]
MDITNYVHSNRERALQIGDYATYRSQLSRQVLSVRKRLGRTTPKNAKFTPKSPVTAEDIASSHDFVNLLLLTAERAWAHAMYMKAAHTQNNASQRMTGSTRSHIVSRLCKASKNARQLATLLQDQSTTGATDLDVLEAHAYANALSGTEHFEKHAGTKRAAEAAAQKEKWEQCLEYLSAARVSYAVLLGVTKREVFKEILAGTIDPSIRYVAYQAHVQRTIPIPQVARQLFPDDDEDLMKSVQKVDPDALSDKATSASKAGSVENIPNTIAWRSRTANIVDGSIGQALASLSTAEARLASFLSSAEDSVSSQEKAAAYDDVIIASQDAADATHLAIEDLTKERAEEGDPRMQDLRVTSLAVNYDVVAWRVGRNRMLIGDQDGVDFQPVKQRMSTKEKKSGKDVSAREEGNGKKLARLRDRVKLYDEIILSIDSIKDLRGAVRDSAFIEELDAKRAYFQALRCLNIARSHTLLSSPKNALALLAKASSLASKPLSSPSEDSPPDSAPLKLDIAPSDAKTLHTSLLALVTQHRGLVELHNFEENAALAAKKNLTSAAPIIECLNEYPAAGVDLKNLVDWPPKLRPVPVKPLFFDTAWNYVQYPGQKRKAVPAEKGGMETEDGEEQKPAKKGWFGFGR